MLIVSWKSSSFLAVAAPGIKAGGAMGDSWVRPSLLHVVTVSAKVTALLFCLCDQSCMCCFSGMLSDSSFDASSGVGSEFSFSLMLNMVEGGRKLLRLVSKETTICLVEVLVSIPMITNVGLENGDSPWWGVVDCDDCIIPP